MRTARAILGLCALAGCAGAEGARNARIEAGMMRLGASPERSRCFAERLGADKAAKKAARLVEAASGRDDLRDRVLSADRKTRRAFIAASFACPGMRKER